MFQNAFERVAFCRRPPCTICPGGLRKLGKHPVDIGQPGLLCDYSRLELYNLSLRSFQHFAIPDKARNLGITRNKPVLCLCQGLLNFRYHGVTATQHGLHYGQSRS